MSHNVLRSHDVIRPPNRHDRVLKLAPNSRRNSFSGAYEGTHVQITGLTLPQMPPEMWYLMLNFCLRHDWEVP